MSPRAISQLRASAAVIAAVLIAAAPAGAQTRPPELKISSWLPPAHPVTMALENWGKAVAQASKGSIKYRLFVAQELGKAQDQYKMVRSGAAHVAVLSPGVQPESFAALEAAALPLLVSNAVEGSAAIDAWYRSHAEREMKGVRFCLAFTHEPGTLHGRRRIAAPADLRGTKVHAANESIARLARQAGGVGVEAQTGEARQMIENGRLDAVAFPWGSLSLFRLERAARHHLDLPLYVTPFAIVMHAQTYDGMTDEQKEVIDGHCNSGWAMKIAGPWSEFESAARQKLLQQKDREAHLPSDAELAQWRKAADAQAAQWSVSAKKAGLNSREVLDGLKSALAARGALVK